MDIQPVHVLDIKKEKKKLVEFIIFVKLKRLVLKKGKSFNFACYGNYLLFFFSSSFKAASFLSTTFSNSTCT